MIVLLRYNYFTVQRILLLLSLVVLCSCNATRFVPDGKYLLNRISVNVDTKNLKRDVLKTHIRQKENLRILGALKFHLGVYNLSSGTKNDDWLKRIGEAPVLYDEYLTQRSLDQLQIYLKNKGYYNAVVKDSLIVNEGKKKINLIFEIKTNQPSRIRNSTYFIKDPNLRSIILKDSVNIEEQIRFIFQVS